MSAEDALIKCKESVQGPLKVRTVELNIPQLPRQVHSAVHLLSVCNSVILTKRKSEIKNYLHPKYHYLTKPSNPVTDELLGPNVEQKVNDSNKLYEAGRKLGCSSRGFRFFNQGSRYRGRNSSFRGNRSTPYQNNQRDGNSFHSPQGTLQYPQCHNFDSRRTRQHGTYRRGGHFPLINNGGPTACPQG